MRSAVLATLAILVGCSRGEPPSGTSRTDAAALPADGLPVLPASDAAAAATPGLPSFSRALAEGRAHGHARRWAEAVVALERAQALEPDNAVVLVELGWAAFNAGNDAVAQRANERALAANPTPAQRAQALYNEGRRLEAAGHLDDARAAYEGSLAARDSDAVQKRLESLGQDAGTAAPPLDAGAPLRPRAASKVPCPAAHADEAALRTCLEKTVHEASARTGGTFFFQTEPDLEGVPPKLRVVRFGEGTETARHLRSTLLLLAETPRGLLPLATLGSGHEPPLPAARTQVSWKGSEKKPSGVWFLRSRQSRIGQELGGLEVKEDTVEYLTACVLADGEPDCPVQIPITTREKLAYPNPSDLDADEQRAVSERIRDLGPAYDRTTQLLPTLDKAGRTLTVTIATGRREDIPRGVVGVHPLR